MGLQAVAKEVLARRSELNPRDIFTLLRAYARSEMSGLNVAPSPLFFGLRDSVSQQLEFFSTKELVGVTWAYARTGLAISRWLRPLIEATLHKLQELDPAHLCALVWSLAAVRANDLSHLVEALEHE